ncbi:MAG: V-type ATPase subunit [Candidatus Bilamarchaeaceae archaeon]
MKFPQMKLESRALKYGYSNARVRAMKGLLIREQDLDEMVHLNSVSAMLELLRRTPYKQDVESAAAYSGSDAVEIAAAKNFSRVVSKILSFAPKEDLPVIRALLKKWDLLSIKTIIHAKQAGVPSERIRPYLFSVGGLSQEDFERLIRANGDELFAELKKTDIGKEMLSIGTAAFSGHMRAVFNNALKNMNSFLQVESILDAYIYLFMDSGLSSVRSKEVEGIRLLLKKEIDAKNIMIIERLKARGFQKNEIEKYLIKGGTLKPSVIEKLCESKEKQTVLAFIKSKFRGIEISDDYSLSQLEIALEKQLAAEKHALFGKSMLSIGVILGFLLVKEEEMNNLRKIAKAKEFGISADEVKKMLVVV